MRDSRTSGSSSLAFEAADDLSVAEALGSAALNGVAGGLVIAHPDDDDAVERALGGAVAAAVHSVPVGASR